GRSGCVLRSEDNCIDTLGNEVIDLIDLLRRVVVSGQQDNLGPQFVAGLLDAVSFGDVEQRLLVGNRYTDGALLLLATAAGAGATATGTVAATSAGTHEHRYQRYGRRQHDSRAFHHVP